jgi:hypothetical protein
MLLPRILLAFALLAPHTVFAADPAGDKAAAKPVPAKTAATAVRKEDPAAGKSADALSTNVVGSQEAPTVLNVVPWKDKEVKLEKKNPTTNILNNVLQPLDRDVLRREVQYFRSLQEATQ